MIENIIIVVLIILVILFLTYYAKSISLTLEEKGISLKVKAKTVLLETTNVKTTPITFSNVTIMQHKLSDGSYFEVATCEPSYAFNEDTKQVIKRLFEANKIELLFSIRNLSAMRVTLKNAQVVNLFVDDSDLTTLKFVYGIPYEIFSPAVKKLRGRGFKEFRIGGMFALAVPITKWRLLHNDYDEIITARTL